MVNKYIFFIFLVFCTFVYKCNSQNNGEINYLTVEELILKGINNNNDSILKKIGKNVNKLILNTNLFFIYNISDSIDLKQNKHLLKITKQQYDPDRIVTYHSKGFEICIKNQDSVFLGGFLLKENQIIDAFKGYCKTIQNHDILAITRDSIPYIGYVEIIQPVVYLGVDIKFRGVLNSEEWKIYFRSLKSLIYYYKMIRNKVSLNYFEKEFSRISPEKKLSILKYKPLKIFLLFDMSFCSRALLPTDFEDTEPDW